MRNLGLIIAIWLATLLPSNSLALGLGEIEVTSFLNQPLNAEIQVISARPGEIDDLLVSLASREAFTRAGLSRPRHLSELRFAVKKNEEGDEAVVIVTTKSAVKEPFLNFLIEADWSKGRVLREFTVLLDPPFYAEQPAPAETTTQAAEQPAGEESSVTDIVAQAGVTSTVESSEPAASGTEITEPIALTEDTSDEMVAEPEPEPVSQTYSDETPSIAQGDVMVSKGDTLWSIASRYKDADHSMAQVMLAFQRTNPDAFNDGNINNLKVGAVLRAPGSEEIDAVGKQESHAEVLVQNGLWDEYVARVTGVSPAMASEEASTEPTEATVAEEGSTETDGGELSLLLPGDGDSESSGTGEAGDVSELRTKLALAEEELDASRIENQDLEARIAELQLRLSKLEELQKMVEIEDDSLTAIQEQQSESAEVEEQQEEQVTNDSVTEAIESNEEALLEELLAEEAAAQAEEQAVIDGSDTEETMGEGEDSLAEDALVEDTMSEDAMTEEPVAEASGSDDMMSEEAETESTLTPPAPVILTEPVTRSPSIFDGILPPSIIDMIPSMPSMSGILGDPIILAAVGGVIVLLLVLVILKRRKAASDDESGIVAGGNDEDLFASEEEDELTPIHLADGAEPVATDIKLPTEEDMGAEETAVEPQEDLAATAIISAVDMPEPEASAPAAAGDQDDVLNEVDVYLAYGLYDNAEELLNSSLTENPDRADYRSKLLDTYFATKKSDAFVKEADKLKSMGDAASSYWDRVQIMGYELAPDNALFSDAKDSDMSAADLEFTRPQEADFDLGASEGDDTNFSTTDFNLGEDDTGGDFTDTASMGEAGEIAETQQINQLDELADLDFDDDDDTNLRNEDEADAPVDLPDSVGDELEFSMDDEGSGDADAQLPDDLDVATSEDSAVADVDLDELAMEFDIDEEEADKVDEISEVDFGAEFDAALEEEDGLDDVGDAEEIPFEADLTDSTTSEAGIDEDAVELDAPALEATEVVPALSDSEEGGEEIDLGMEDTAMIDFDPTTLEDETSLATGELNLETSELVLDTGELNLETSEQLLPEADDDEDISIIDFGGEDFVEPTDIIESVADDDDSVMMGVDDDEDTKTGTFAPGDFEEPTEAVDPISDIDDIGDLMLPDDVDEVSTKLDLARAFIDMGDTEGARGSLEEVMSEGNDEQKAEAKSLLDQI